jgi:hypothetical protein
MEYIFMYIDFSDPSHFDVAKRFHIRPKDLPTIRASDNLKFKKYKMEPSKTWLKNTFKSEVIVEFMHSIKMKTTEPWPASEKLTEEEQDGDVVKRFMGSDFADAMEQTDRPVALMLYSSEKEDYKDDIKFFRGFADGDDLLTYGMMDLDKNSAFGISDYDQLKVPSFHIVQGYRQRIKSFY